MGCSRTIVLSKCDYVRLSMQGFGDASEEKRDDDLSDIDCFLVAADHQIFELIEMLPSLLDHPASRSRAGTVAGPSASAANTPSLKRTIRGANAISRWP